MRKIRTIVAACCLAALGCAASPRAFAASRPVVVELYTSQACSDCPPADALLRRLQTADPDLLALDLHVTYFNGPGWRDPFSAAAETDRQYWYAGLRHDHEVFTPEAIVDGRASVVGSNRAALRAAIASARGKAADAPATVGLERRGNTWRVSVDGAAPGAPAMITAFRFDAADTTHVRGGENGGATLSEIHVVRSIDPLGAWTGGEAAWSLKADGIAHLAVIVQRPDGTILGAAER